ncbi:o-succinylbenzoate--CoA ligase [Paenarthrobacter aurescens]|uniref:Fatty-acyl-CoA synthase n=1 Tax=Paenarthrobacter aurescens TaxID=43663 RepID=A0A4Y3NH98_PAEAU|nr:o-succinylbenzoate--CoA ligase [Paenarthrobacter aurescens]MDO6142551.1 o-succinylbenzoate--CoA ligase [Paenarthrobacter aurescens]MDO6146398.1 o-succinylbenzoate--CoA ligase [Paenarthrobacter aurescens]MDO6157643.1 o-succinylbenzoate--CoA ligase [Paenarthrobacter aurescens]MDO6161628.1 o-succinylbenzoate--CoA ligase [Paenarthrobacter aurescens]GEB21102.1 fatty-acyl-CoA synthase [Paenarthrobacter aurescens]
MDNNGVGSWLHRRRIKSGTKTAVISGGTSLSYAELADRTAHLANALKERGVGKGDRVAYLGENHPSFVETFFACGLLGAIFVPLNTRLAAPELQYQLQDSGSLLLISAASLETVAAASSRETEVTHRLVVAPDDVTDGSAPTLPSGVEHYDDVMASASAAPPDEAVTLDDGAMILYTSGTTGKPKGALLTHGNITWNCMNTVVDMDLNRNDVALMISPLFHVASLDMGLLPMLLKGATVVLEAKFDAGRVLELVGQYKITTLNGVPTTFQMLCDHPGWSTADLSSLDKLTCGGSAVPQRVLDAYEQRGIGFTSCYGMTETAPGATMLPVSRSKEKAGSAGLPHFFTDVRIADPLGGVAVQGEVGEIQISGPNVIKEYWNRPEATAESYSDSSWFRSGDMGYQDAEGFLFVSDRIKDMIISGGENIYPAEVEAAIAELTAVGSVAVIGVDDPKWGEVPRAIVTLREGGSLTEEQLRSHLEGRLARYKIPKSVVFVEEMPRTASGKIRKMDLRKQYAQ